MSVEAKISSIYTAYYAARGLTLEQLTVATASIAKELHLDERELERRLEGIEQVVKKLPGGPNNG